MAELMDTKNEIKQKINEILKEKEKKVSPKIHQMLEETIYRIQTEPIEIKDVLNFNPQLIEKIYSYGYQLVQAGKYKEALPVFTFLKQIDASDPRYIFCIATCYYYLKEYTNAAANYIIHTQLQTNYPISHFHLYSCFLKLNQPLGALKAIWDCINTCGNQSKYATLKERSQLEYNNLLKDLRVLWKKQYGEDALVNPASKG
jgi:type III secretion system low calcium response chaperone LcrH/SycD